MSSGRKREGPNLANIVDSLFKIAAVPVEVTGKLLTCNQPRRKRKTGFEILEEEEDGMVIIDGGAAELPAYRRCILVTCSMFMGYAALVTLQHQLKDERDKSEHPPDANAFEHASQLNYLGNLIFRLAHNFVFAFLTPRQRVRLSLLCMAIAMILLAVFVCLLRSTWMGWIVLAYLLGGVAVGTHESNLLACITPLGHATKKWAVLGLPLGFTLVSVGGFLMLLCGVPLHALYLLSAGACLSSLVVFGTVPSVHPQTPDRAGGGGGALAPRRGTGARLGGGQQQPSPLPSPPILSPLPSPSPSPSPSPLPSPLPSSLPSPSPPPSPSCAERQHTAPPHPYAGAGMRAAARFAPPASERISLPPPAPPARQTRPADVAAKGSGAVGTAPSPSEADGAAASSSSAASACASAADTAYELYRELDKGLDELDKELDKGLEDGRAFLDELGVFSSFHETVYARQKDRPSQGAVKMSARELAAAQKKKRWQQQQQQGEGAGQASPKHPSQQTRRRPSGVHGAGGELTPYERFQEDLAAWRRWLPLIVPHAAALLVSMCAVSFISAIMYYLLNDSGPGGVVPLLGPDSAWPLVRHDAFFAVSNLCSFAGDSISRQIVYAHGARLIHPLFFLPLTAVGAALALCKVPLLAPAGLFLIFFANGAVYATSTKHIDTNVSRNTTLTALSVWLFVGDFGAVLGSNTWQAIAPIICEGVHSPHMCL